MWLNKVSQPITSKVTEKWCTQNLSYFYDSRIDFNSLVVQINIGNKTARTDALH